MKKSIIEILNTGKLQKVENLTSHVKNETIDLFSQIWGMGIRKASLLYTKGMRTLEDLRRNEYLLNKTQRNGLAQIEMSKCRIPRQEQEQIIEIVRRKVHDLSPND